jgi:2,4-dienoyl-CoA reductase-like NADH-dependent reductase (Old Yellow Enzyme family)
MGTTIEKLLQPIKINKLEIKNRICYAPTGKSHFTEDGYMTDQAICYYVARAKGGTGLLIVEVCLPHTKYARPVRRLLGCWDDSQLAGLKNLAEAIHAAGAKAIVQESLGFGAQAMFPIGGEVVAPSNVPTTIRKGGAPRGLQYMEEVPGTIPRPLTREEIVELEDAFASGAERLMKAGFDGIEIHGCHGYLIAQFISPYSNKRQDEYGGASLESRLRLPLNLIKKSREKVGPDFVIGFRMSGDEHIEGGYNLEEGQKIAQEFEKAGVDYIHLSSGRYEVMNRMLPDEEGTMLDEAKAIKEAVKIPVICPNIHDPLTGEKALQDGMTDIVSLSRGLIADPAWANKVKEGKIQEINRCRLCNYCLKTLFSGFTIRCAVNPEVGWERFIPEYHPPIRRR